jgi:RHS repeat-associated protein
MTGLSASEAEPNHQQRVCGEAHDCQGLACLRARYYHPDNAQFLTRDAAAATTRSSYGYVAGNLLNGADPSCLASCDMTMPTACADDPSG